MITIQNGKLHIPDEDRFVGFAGDDSVNQKKFVLLNRVQESCSFILCLRFDDDTVRSVSLSAENSDDNTVLTWNIQSDQLYAPGIVTAQIKAVGSDGSVNHSTKDFFLIGSSVELSEDGAEAEYVTPSQLRNSINQALEKLSATAPYVDEEGYWCVYDPATEKYQRTGYHISGIAPDSAMSDSSENTVSNKCIKNYIDEKASECNVFARGCADVAAADKVPQTRTIAQLPLSDNINGVDLMSALRPHLYKMNVLPNSSGIKGQIGIGPAKEVFFCTDTDEWQQLVRHQKLDEKMDLIEEIPSAEMEDVADGNLFVCGDVLYAKYNDTAVALSKANDVYSKTEIDTKIGDVESLLAEV